LVENFHALTSLVCGRRGYGWLRFAGGALGVFDLGVELLG
jgi:hypothetical protein